MLLKFPRAQKFYSIEIIDIKAVIRKVFSIQKLDFSKILRFDRCKSIDLTKISFLEVQRFQYRTDYTHQEKFV